MNTNKTNSTIKFMIFTAVVFASLFYTINTAKAELMLDGVYFDPAVISSGDEVDVVVQFHDSSYSLKEPKEQSEGYKFEIRLEADDSLTEKYVLIQDAKGDNLQGIIYRGGYYNKKFRVKVSNNAPAGNYEFKIVGQWLKNGNPEEGEQYVRIMMPVKKEGISLSISNVVSDPEKVRSGDKNVLLKTEIFNSGEKTAKNVKIAISYPNGIKSSYTNNNELTLGVIDAMQKASVNFYVDTDNNMKEGVYKIVYYLEYQDLDGNSYTKTGTFPFVIKKKPKIVVLSSEGNATTSSNAQLRVTLKNIGEEKSDSVDIRLIKQSDQPFDIDVRSDYVGQMLPNQTAVAIFNLGVMRDAELKEHQFSVLIRAKGNTEEGDSNIYTYTDSVSLNVTSEKSNPYPQIAVALLVLVILVTLAVIYFKKK